jgi:hypothetical protein
MKKKYYHFKIGEVVMLNESIISEGIHIDKGFTFVIIDFPYCTIRSKHQNFVYGVFTNIKIYCEIDQIIKIRKNSK